MLGEYKIITLCGSTRFKDEFLRVQKELTLQGNIVISVGIFSHSDKEDEKLLMTMTNSESVLEMLRDIHKKKIDMADEIYVINVDGYIGENTQSEIEYAISKGKKVKYRYDYDINKENKVVEEMVEELLSEKEFEERYCKLCGSQRCEGIGSVFFEGCAHRDKLKYV